MRPNDVFLDLVDQATSGRHWVIDGNYSRSRAITWPRADTVVWLDYPLPLTLWRLWWRTLRRTLRQEELWNGNRERLTTHLFTRDSLFLWALMTYRRRRREYPVLLSAPENAHLALVRLRSPRQTEKWLLSI
jgi:adenylate kinase family enzyme